MLASCRHISPRSHGSIRAWNPHFCRATRHRGLLTLAIETSCDDTCVAVLETQPRDPQQSNSSPPASTATLHFEKRITASDEYKGIHPVLALESHHRSLATLVREAISTTKLSERGSRPDFVSVTRGPGMRTNLGVGIEMAKGLSLAWGVPLMGVHHMQAHLLTPRLVHAMSGQDAKPTPTQEPDFPFLSLLVSGGHSMLVASTSVTDHRIIAGTLDLAVGNFIDRAARLILPEESASFRGPAFEHFAWPNKEYLRDYIPHQGGKPTAEMSPYGWAIKPPLIGGRDGRASNLMAYSFSGLLTGLERALTQVPDPQTGRPTNSARDAKTIGAEERRELARHAQTIAFEHMLSRVLMYLESLKSDQRLKISSLVLSGGVAANECLRHVLRAGLDLHNHERIKLCVPPIPLCTDNAAMIGWAGTEMWNQGWQSSLDMLPIKEWSLDVGTVDGGVLGVNGWTRR